MAISLKVSNLSLSFGEQHILKNISFEVEQGTVCAFIGANGAGKTTTIKCIVGLYPYKDGEITIDNVDAKKSQSRYNLGYVPEKENFPKIKVKHFIDTLNEYYHLPKDKSNDMTSKLFKLFNIEGFQNIKLPKLSSGQRKKILIIQSLVHNPDILIMDEPTENMDPDARLIFYDIVKQLKKLKKTIFISTHNLDEIQKYADKAIIIKDGEIKYTGDINSKGLYEMYEKYTDHNNVVETTTIEKKLTPEDIFN